MSFSDGSHALSELEYGDQDANSHWLIDTGDTDLGYRINFINKSQFWCGEWRKSYLHLLSQNLLKTWRKMVRIV